MGTLSLSKNKYDSVEVMRLILMTSKVLRLQLKQVEQRLYIWCTKATPRSIFIYKVAGLVAKCLVVMREGETDRGAERESKRYREKEEERERREIERVRDRERGREREREEERE